MAIETLLVLLEASTSMVPLKRGNYRLIQMCKFEIRKQKLSVATDVSHYKTNKKETNAVLHVLYVHGILFVCITITFIFILF